MRHGVFGVATLGVVVLTCAVFAAVRRPAPVKRLTPKVLVIIYNPIIEAEGGKRLVDVCGWNDPRTLMKEYIADIQEVSGGFVSYQVAQVLEVDEFPVKKDGFTYTDEEYMRCWRSGKGWHQPDGVDYREIIRKYNIARRVEAREIDEVWLFGMPYAGFWESTMAGKGAYFCNSDPVPGVDCSRIFVVMGFNYERGVGEMLEDLGHRTESIMTHVFGSWEPKETHAWNRFTLYDKVAPGRAACGNVHFAPNSEKDYDWGNKRRVWSTCDDWLSYPKLTGKRRLVDCSEWGGGDIREHHKWWFRHIPKAPGRTQGKLNNWWCYIVDFNSYPESR